MDAKKKLEKRVITASQENSISAALFRNAIGKKLGLNVADVECFCFLSLRGVSTPTELARYTGLTTGSATAMLNRLEKANLITRKPNPHDKRGVLIAANKASAATVRPIIVAVQKAHGELIASYSDNELEVIADFLTRFAGNVERYTQMIDQI